MESDQVNEIIPSILASFQIWRENNPAAKVGENTLTVWDWLKEISDHYLGQYISAATSELQSPEHIHPVIRDAATEIVAWETGKELSKYNPLPDRVLRHAQNLCSRICLEAGMRLGQFSVEQVPLHLEMPADGVLLSPELSEHFSEEIAEVSAEDEPAVAS